MNKRNFSSHELILILQIPIVVVMIKYLRWWTRSQMHCINLLLMILQEKCLENNAEMDFSVTENE